MSYFAKLVLAALILHSYQNKASCFTSLSRCFTSRPMSAEHDALFSERNATKKNVWSIYETEAVI